MPIDASIPLQAVQGQVNPLDTFTRAAQLAHVIQANKAGQLDIRAREQQLDDDQKMREAMRNSYDAQGNFSWQMLKQNAARSGVNPTTLQAIEQGHAMAVDKLANADKVQLDNLEKQHDILRGYTSQIMQAPPDQRPTLWQWGVQRA